jgi:hypothetical protein
MCVAQFLFGLQPVLEFAPRQESALLRAIVGGLRDPAPTCVGRDLRYRILQSDDCFLPGFGGRGFGAHEALLQLQKQTPRHFAAARSIVQQLHGIGASARDLNAACA